MADDVWQGRFPSRALGTTDELSEANVGRGAVRRLVVVLDGDDQFAIELGVARELAAWRRMGAGRKERRRGFI